MASPAADEWTEDKCIQLIREFRARPILWDPKDPYFFKKTLKPMAWVDIGKAISRDPDSCKHKMVVLMSSFRREKAKIMHSISDTNIEETGYSYKSTWFAFKEMAFLMDKDNERKRQLGDDTEDEDKPSIKKVILQHFIETPTSKAPHRRTSKAHRQKKTPELIEELSALPPPPPLPPMLQMKPPSPAPAPSAPPPRTQTSSERDEEIKSFITFIGNKMKKYSDETKNAVQQAICDVIFKADQHLYENSGCEKYTIVVSENDPFKEEQSFETSTMKTQILYSDSE